MTLEELLAAWDAADAAVDAANEALEAVIADYFAARRAFLAALVAQDKEQTDN